MNPGIFSNLARASQLAANHSCAGYRFWMTLSLLASIALQNDPDGVFIGIDSVEDFLLNGHPDQMDAVMCRHQSGDVVEIDHWPVSIGNEPLAALSREIALLSDAEPRVTILEAVSFKLIQDNTISLNDLVTAVGEIRSGASGLNDFDFPQPVHDDLGSELEAALTADAGGEPRAHFN